MSKLSGMGTFRQGLPLSQECTKKQVTFLSEGGQKKGSMKPPQDGHDGASHVGNGPPGILVELEGVERPVIIDTGADVNVISKKIVDSQGWTKFKQKTNEQIMGVNGQ